MLCCYNKTSLQVLALQHEGDAVEVRKQRTSFPPNFVHTLDGYMMMTATAYRNVGLHFAAFLRCHYIFMSASYLRNTYGTNFQPFSILKEFFVDVFATVVKNV